MREDLPKQPSENNKKKARFDLQTAGFGVYKNSMVIVVELSGLRALIKVASFISKKMCAETEKSSLNRPHGIRYLIVCMQRQVLDLSDKRNCR